MEEWSEGKYGIVGVEHKVGCDACVRQNELDRCNVWRCVLPLG